MARTTKEVGDAWGRLVGLAIDACQAHHEAHCACAEAGDPAAKIIRPRDPRERNIPDPHGEVGEFVVTVGQRCPDSWTGTKGEVRVNYEVTAVTSLAAPSMCRLPADGPMASQGHAASAPPSVPQGVNDVVVSLAALVSSLDRGLYVGRLCPVTGGVPDVPVLIFLDDVGP